MCQLLRDVRVARNRMAATCFKPRRRGGKSGPKRNLESRPPLCKLMFTMTPMPTATNAKKVAQLQQAMAEILAEALRRGFFGTAAVEFSVQDGTIQNIRRKVERVEK